MKAIWEYISTRAKYALSTKQVMALIMSGLAIFHAALTFFYAVQSILPMMIIDGISMLMYIYCYIQVKKNKNLLLVFNLSYAEIMLHSLLSVVLMGGESGFALFPIALLSLGYYAAYNFNSGKETVNPMFYVIFAVIDFFVARIFGMFIKPLYSYRNETTGPILYMINYGVVLIIIILFFSTLLNQIKLLESQRLHQNQKLEELSKTDALTGLANRRSLQERYEDSELLKGGYAIILGDIDDFKLVNDTYGHNVGDLTLKAVSNVFKNAVRGEDTVCRWGGEEILVFLPRCPYDSARSRAEDILNNIRELELEANPQTKFHITMTLGVATSDEGGRFSDIVKKSDERLYEGKQNGKNQIV